MANGFKFNEEDTITLRNRPKAKLRGFAGTLINWGLAKTETQANMYLVAVVVVCIAVIIYQNRHLL